MTRKRIGSGLLESSRTPAGVLDEVKSRCADTSQLRDHDVQPEPSTLPKSLLEPLPPAKPRTRARLTWIRPTRIIRNAGTRTQARLMMTAELRSCFGPVPVCWRRLDVVYGLPPGEHDGLTGASGFHPPSTEYP